MKKTEIQFKRALVLAPYNSKEQCTPITSVYIKLEMTELKQQAKCAYIVNNSLLSAMSLVNLPLMASSAWPQLQEMLLSFKIFSTKGKLSNHSWVLTSNTQRMLTNSHVSTSDGSITLKLKVEKMVCFGIQMWELMLGLYWSKILVMARLTYKKMEEFQSRP